MDISGILVALRARPVVHFTKQQEYHLIININHGRYKIDEKLASRSRCKNDFLVRHSSRLNARKRKDARTERTPRQQR